MKGDSCFRGPGDMTPAVICAQFSLTHTTLLAGNIPNPEIPMGVEVGHPVPLSPRPGWHLGHLGGDPLQQEALWGNARS